MFILNVITDPRLDVVGPLPGDLQREIVYTAGSALKPREAEAA